MIWAIIYDMLFKVPRLEQAYANIAEKTLGFAKVQCLGAVSLWPRFVVSTGLRANIESEAKHQQGAGQLYCTL